MSERINKFRFTEIQVPAPSRNTGVLGVEAVGFVQFSVYLMNRGVALWQRFTGNRTT